MSRLKAVFYLDPWGYIPLAPADTPLAEKQKHPLYIGRCFGVLSIPWMVAEPPNAQVIV